MNQARSVKEVVEKWHEQGYSLNKHLLDVKPRNTILHESQMRLEPFARDILEAVKEEFTYGTSFDSSTKADIDAKLDQIIKSL